MPPLVHFKYNNIIDLSCIISQSLVTDNVGFNRIKYEYSLCRSHPYPQLTTPTRISLENSFPEVISGPPESPWQLSLNWPVATHTISLCIWPWYESRGNSAPFWIRRSVIRNDFYWNLDNSGACHIAIYLALVQVKRKQWTFLNTNKRHSEWLKSKPGAIHCSATAGCFRLLSGSGFKTPGITAIPATAIVLPFGYF